MRAGLEKSETGLGKGESSGGEGAGLGSGWGHDLTNQERHVGSASSGLRFLWLFWWQCGSKQQLGQGAERVVAAGRPLEGSTELGSLWAPVFPVARSRPLGSSGLKSAGGGRTQVLTPFRQVPKLRSGEELGPAKMGVTWGESSRAALSLSSRGCWVWAGRKGCLRLHHPLAPAPEGGMQL